MSSHKKPGKNSSQQGRKKLVPTPDWATAVNPPPSPFMRAGFDIGVDLSVHPPHGSQRSQGNVPAQTSATATTTTASAVAFSAPTTTSNGAQVAKGSGGTSSRKALAPKAKAASGTKKATTPRAASRGRKGTAPRAAPTTPRGPKKGRGKTGAAPKVTPSKRAREESPPDLSYYSNNRPDEMTLFDSDSESADYKKNGRGRYAKYNDEDEQDDLEQLEHEYGLRNEDDDDDEYSRYYDGDDYHVKKQRR